MSDERAIPGRPWLIDAAIYVHFAYQAEVSESKRNDGPIATLDPRVNTTGLRLASMIRDLHGRFGFDTAIAAWNGLSDRQWRPKYAPTYKSNRPPKPPGLRELLDAAPRIFAELGIRSFDLDEYEADDLIASACHRYFGCVIVSNDKDFYQLLGVNGTRIWDPRKRRDTGPKGAIGLTPDPGPTGAWIELEDVVAKFGVPPERVIDVQAIMGDSADGVPGAHGVGAKGAATLINTYGDLDAVLTADPSCVNGTVGKLVRLVHDARDKVAQARRLVTLATHLDVPVYPVTPPAPRGVGAFLNPRNLEPETMTSPFAKILGAPPPPAPAAPSLKDRLNAEAATAAGAPTPPAPPAPRPTAPSTADVVELQAKQCKVQGKTLQEAMDLIGPWAANQVEHLSSTETGAILRRVYGPPAPPVQHYPTDKAGADVVRSMIRMTAEKAAHAGRSFAAALAEAQAFNAARPDDVRLNAGECDQIVAGAYAAATPRIEYQAAPPPPATAPSVVDNGRPVYVTPPAPPAPPVSAAAAGPINPPDGVPADAQAIEYAPGGALDPNRKAPKEDLVVPPGFGQWSGRTWTSIVKDDAALFQLELVKQVSATPRHNQYLVASTCPAKGAKRSELLEDCKLIVSILTNKGPVEAPAPPGPPVATIPEPEPRPAPVPIAQVAEAVAQVANAPRMVEVPIGAFSRDEAPRPPSSTNARIESTPHDAPPVQVPEVYEDDVEDEESEPLASLVGGLFVDCYPTRWDAEKTMWTLTELVELCGWARAVAADLGVIHYGIADYRKGARGIAAHLDEYVRRGVLRDGVLLIDTRIDYAGECLAVLEPLAGLVVRRIG